MLDAYHDRNLAMSGNERACYESGDDELGIHSKSGW